MKKVKGLNINHLGFTPVKLGDFLYDEGDTSDFGKTMFYY
ncbi:MAG: hypothetical protein RIS64_624 [Bacteroidota bacterium]|jgi:hypothetical protein